MGTGIGNLEDIGNAQMQIEANVSFNDLKYCIGYLEIMF